MARVVETEVRSIGLGVVGRLPTPATPASPATPQRSVPIQLVPPKKAQREPQNKVLELRDGLMRTLTEQFAGEVESRARPTEQRSPVTPPCARGARSSAPSARGRRPGACQGAPLD